MSGNESNESVDSDGGESPVDVNADVESFTESGEGEEDESVESTGDQIEGEDVLDLTVTANPSSRPYPNTDKQGDVNVRKYYQNLNMYIPEDLHEDFQDIKKELDYQFSMEGKGEIDKNWDFYTAAIQVVVNHPELLRAELGIDPEGP